MASGNSLVSVAGIGAGIGAQALQALVSAGIGEALVSEALVSDLPKSTNSPQLLARDRRALSRSKSKTEDVR